MRKLLFLKLAFFAFLTMISSSCFALSRSPAIQKTDLTSMSGVEEHIKRELSKTISLIVKPSRFIVESRISIRANRRVKAKTFYLGKLGAQPKSSGRDKIIREKITNRITKVEIDLYLHPLVEADKKKIIVNLVKNSTPFVSPSRVSLNLQTMRVISESFVWDEYIDNIHFWMVANKRVFKIVGWSLFALFMFFGIGRLSWKFVKRKYKEARSFIENRITEVKSIGVPEIQDVGQWKEKINSQMKLFNVHSKGLVRRKALTIKNWLYEDEQNSEFVLAALPNLLGESEFTAVFKFLPESLQVKWQNIISNIFWEREEYKVFEYLQAKNLEILKETHSQDEWSLGESCVDLNVEQTSILLEFSKKYALPLANVISSVEWKEILDNVSEGEKIQIMASAINNNSKRINKFEFNAEEFDNVKKNVMNTYSSESKKNEKIEILAGSINVKDEIVLHDIVKGCKNVEMIYPIFRKVMPMSILLDMPLELYVPVLSMIPVKDRVRFILLLNDDLKRKVLSRFDKRMGETGKIIRQELALLEQNEILCQKIQNDPVKYCNNVFNTIRNELKEKDHLFHKVEYKLKKWIQEIFDNEGECDVDKAA